MSPGDELGAAQLAMANAVLRVVDLDEAFRRRHRGRGTYPAEVFGGFAEDMQRAGRELERRSAQVVDLLKVRARAARREAGGW